ncbi:hypothetical protein NE857_08125 [Nocardiopsis exhalans]|uniref:Uncharacterized protein n=1 Tax=Nocardiopsis exhalans TaxID=163604 RepID=A0ABY5DCR8_9ACTN|nr:hypothetical protein [Nocardiopsis exhalans]USY21561.1 hypothetical protein NE857_08125 [Nocardiopsis exhalans]
MSETDTEAAAPWAGVRGCNASPTGAERRAYLHGRTLQDDLADRRDDRLTETDAW